MGLRLIGTDACMHASWHSVLPSMPAPPGAHLWYRMRADARLRRVSSCSQPTL